MLPFKDTSCRTWLSPLCVACSNSHEQWCGIKDNTQPVLGYVRGRRKTAQCKLIIYSRVILILFSSFWTLQSIPGLRILTRQHLGQQRGTDGPGEKEKSTDVENRAQRCVLPHSVIKIVSPVKWSHILSDPFPLQPWNPPSSHHKSIRTFSSSKH